MALADDFRALLQELPTDWEEASVLVRLADEDTARRAAALLRLAQSGPARHGRPLRRLAHGRRRSRTSRSAACAASTRPGSAARWCSSRARSPTPAPEPARASLAAAWDVEVAALPPDWSDVYAELELRSTDNLEQGALLAAPINPARVDERPAFRFRCARQFGYGAAPGMVRRCLERLDSADIRGEVHILRALSDTKPWATQGPVWYVDGRSV